MMGWVNNRTLPMVKVIWRPRVLVQFETKISLYRGFVYKNHGIFV